MNGNFKNCTKETDFHLVSFSMSAHAQLGIFSLILSMYSVTMLGNVLIIGLICLMSQLHTPMYFFLCNLSIQDIIYVSDTLPKFLAVTMSGDGRIAFPACLTQLLIFDFCIGTEFLLLALMAYDRYVAICVPLHYTVIMRKLLCIVLAAISWLTGFLNALSQALMLLYSEFCNSHNVDHFYCDLKAVIKLVSSDTTLVNTLLSVIAVVMGFVPLFFILATYICIISAITKMRTSGVRVKAFSSCSSHLTVVMLFCGSSLGYYSIPQSEHTQEQNKMLSLLYTALVPLLNPLVYTLRNKDVLRAMKQVRDRYLGSRRPTFN